MASSFSTNLKLELMTTGEKSGTWGTITNTNLQQLEQAASGYISVDVAEVQSICNAVWTDAVKEAWRVKLVTDNESS